MAAIAWVPVLLMAGAMVLVFTGRPVLYRSMRRVDSGKVIRIVKFRTMVKNAEQLANRATVPVDNNVRFLNIPPNSPLYTSVGRLLERCGITELPQFAHVLRGQMSIVGNRPLPENVMRAPARGVPQRRGPVPDSRRPDRPRPARRPRLTHRR